MGILRPCSRASKYFLEVNHGIAAKNVRLAKKNTLLTLLAVMLKI